MEIQVMVASVPGTRHTLPGSPNWINNQDSYSVVKLPGDLGCIAVVCDGCSGGRRSEVGAAIAAKRLTSLIAEELMGGHCALERLPWEKIRTKLVSFLAQEARSLCGPDDEQGIVSVIEEYFLFTIVGMIITEELVCFFSMGDGYYALNGAFVNLGPFPENKPPYLMYAVTGSPVLDANPELEKFRVELFWADGIETVLIGCDGTEDVLAAHEGNCCYPGKIETVGPVSRLFMAEFFNNKDNLRRHLALMNRETVREGKIQAGLLPDDTTIVMARLARDETKEENK